jgi:hypothetical protein
MTDTPHPSTSIPIDQLGPAGVRGNLHVLAQFANDPRKDTDRLNDNALRPFKVEARLAKSPLAAEDIKGDFTPEDGGSFLVLPSDVLLSRVRSPEGVFEFHKNSKGEQSFVSFECEAKNPTAAREKFLTTVLPFLDLITYMSDCPIYISLTRIEDQKNHVRTLEYVSPYRKKIIDPQITKLLPEMRPVYALYREAKNSNSDFYKFLCYHKLLEGLLGPLRAEARKKAKKIGISLILDKEFVPDSPDIEQPYRDYIGKPIKGFFDEVLTPRFRNAVAHFITDDGTVLNMSSPEYLDSYATVMFTMELCVRKVIENYLYILLQLDAKK